MSEIQRYSLEIAEVYETDVGMIKDDFGAYVEYHDHASRIKQLEQELAECKAMMGLKDEVIENYAKAVQAHRRELAEAKEVLSLAKSWTAVQKWDVKGNEEGWNYFVNQLDAAIKESSK